MIRKIINTFRLLKCSSLPWRARFQLLYIALKKRIVSSEEFKVNLGLCKIFLSGKDTSTDISTLWGIFVEAFYATDYHKCLVFDIGAHKGYYGAYALLQGAKEVYSFEPENENFESLSRAAKSFRSLTHQKWVVKKSAIGSTNGTIALYVTDRSWSHSMFIHKEAEILRKEIVSMKAFAQVLSQILESKRERIIVKINAEGAGCDIVLGTPIEYWKKVSEVFVTVEPFSPCDSNDILIYLQNAGFDLIGKRGDLLHFKK